jgi:uncharacterized repeat protein (TIGR03847 family)
MERRIFVFPRPDRFVTGTIGEPGRRTFYLQARSGSRIASVVVEKVQVAALADQLAELLDLLESRGLLAPGSTEPDDAPLDEPLNEVFRATVLGLGFDADDGEIIVEARSGLPDEDAGSEVSDEAAEGSDLLRVRLTPAQARAFVIRARRVLAAGRPPCPWCGLPLDPSGHLCPRRNGSGRLH